MITRSSKLTLWVEFAHVDTKVALLLWKPYGDAADLHGIGHFVRSEWADLVDG